MWTWPPKLRLTCNGRSAPGVEMLNVCTGGAPVGCTQVSPPVIAVTLALALLTRRPMELKQTVDTALLAVTVTFVLAFDNTPDPMN